MITITAEISTQTMIAIWTAIQDAINLRGFDEIILSTLPARVSRWLKLDLPSKVSGLGLPVTHVEAKESQPAAS